MTTSLLLCGSVYAALGLFVAARRFLRPKAGADRKAKIVLGASGSHLMLPALPLPLPRTVQLRGHGEFWGASCGCPSRAYGHPDTL
jgi:hypothetical protein